MAPTILRWLSRNDLLDVKAAIIVAESKTSGEIRVKISGKSLSDISPANARNYAISEFYKEHLHETKDGTGVLILVLPVAKKFEIVADAGINARIPQDSWEKLSSAMGECFKVGHIKTGLILAIEEIGKRLSEHFPRQKDDMNELSDDVLVED